MTPSTPAAGALADPLVAQLKRRLPTNILRLRRYLGLSEARLAAAVGITAKQVIAYEAGDELPPLAIVLRLCRLFSVSTDDFLQKTVRQIKSVATPVHRPSL